MPNRTPATDICAIIPCFNEARAIHAVVAGARLYVTHVVVVDDGSHDATAAEAERAGAGVLRLSENQGKGAALKAGFAWAAERHFRAALTLDGDGQHDTDEIPLFVDTFAKTGCALVVGNRMHDLAPMPRVRRWSNRLSSWAISRLAGQKISDTQCGYRLISMTAWQVLSLDSRRYELESEILIRAARHGLRIAEIPVKTIYFTARQSKIRPIVDSLRLLRTLWRCRA